MPVDEFAAGVAEPMRVRGGPTGVLLLLHGFGGTPASMRSWAEHLAERGHAVSVPLLPGHGMHWRELADVPWTARDGRGLAAGAGRRMRAGPRRGPVDGRGAGAPPRGDAARRGRVRRAGEPGAGEPEPAAPAPAGDPAGHEVDPERRAAGEEAGAERIGHSRLPLRAVGTLTRLWRDLRPRLRTVRQSIVLFRSVADGEPGELSSSIVTGSTSPGQGDLAAQQLPPRLGGLRRGADLRGVRTLFRGRVGRPAADGAGRWRAWTTSRRATSLSPAGAIRGPHRSASGAGRTWARRERLSAAVSLVHGSACRRPVFRVCSEHADGTWKFAGSIGFVYSS